MSTQGKVGWKKAKNRLTTMWFIYGSLLFILMILQSVFGAYGQHVDKAWQWFLPTIMPILSLIIGIYVSDITNSGEIQFTYVSLFFYRLSIGISLGYLTLVLLTILLQPLVPIDPYELMQRSNFWLAPSQGLASAALGAFFMRKER